MWVNILFVSLFYYSFITKYPFFPPAAYFEYTVFYSAFKMFPPGAVFLTLASFGNIPAILKLLSVSASYRGTSSLSETEIE